jgi:CheY-like chemotaxis protein
MLAYAGKGRFFVEPVNISSALREISALLHASVSRNIDLHLELQERLPVIAADRGQVQQVLMNLVINAAEAIGTEQPGTVLVTTGTRHVSESEHRNSVVHDGLQPGDYVCLEVRDTGSGMDAATQRRIFDPFFTTKFTGRGLGLSAVLGIVRSHKGTIQVKSEAGQGSVFTVLLPPSAAVQPVPGEPRREHAGIAAGEVLVIDDEETIRRTAKAILEARGLHVFLAETGRAGVDAFRRLSDRISLVIVDLTMPLMNGKEVLREIQAIRHDVPVLISSGYDEMEAMHRVSADAVTGFIQKPYTAAQLLQKVRTALEQSAGARGQT